MARVTYVPEIVLADPVGDYGLLDAAVARNAGTAFGVDDYPNDAAKAAALLQSLARNHALVNGDKRTAWVCGMDVPCTSMASDRATSTSMMTRWS